ncbi:MAG: enoyl-CoA hydratase/isomerase family protein [Acidimicrobiales bacterium]
MSGSRIEVEDDAGVRLIAFDRPEVRNAFDTAMYVAVTEALSAALADDGIRSVVVTGRGKAFTAGQDLREMATMATGDGGPAAGSGFQGLMDVVASFDKPLLAAVNGAGVGLGCTLLAHMDLVLMDERARLRAPFAELGVPPEAASSWLLPERMGWQRASAMLLASEWIDAGQAVEAGLALRVCPEGTVLAETLDVARRIASFAPHATREVKRLMMAPRLHQIAEARAREEAAFAALFADPDINPGAQLIAGLDG